MQKSVSRLSEEPARLPQIDQIARSAQQGTARLLRELMPADVVVATLVALIGLAMNDGFSRSYVLIPLRQADIQVDCQVLVTSGVSDGLQLAAFRIAQEAVTNILRHAEASRVSIAIATVGELLTIEVTDDGVGFRRDAVSRGRGLTGIEERVRGFSGRWSAGATDGGGTVVTAELPLTGGGEPQ